MENTEYILRKSIHSHENDVRCLTSHYRHDTQFLVSGSRDAQVGIFFETQDSDFSKQSSISFNHFVSSVAVLEHENFKDNGLLIVGCNDKSLGIYDFDTGTILQELTGHAHLVSVILSRPDGSFLTGSWDNTVKIWIVRDNTAKWVCENTLIGHNAAVWGVDYEQNKDLIITGAGDRQIKIWKADHCLDTLSGHTDVVRAIRVLNQEQFISCSNDTTIKLWHIESRLCLKTFSGHENFVYNLCLLPSSPDHLKFVSCGEDRTLRVWENGICKQTIYHPAITVWSCTVLKNGDIATGSSDATIRIFTQNAKLAAADEELKNYDQSLSDFEKSTESSKQPLDEKIKTVISDEEILKLPGKQDGETRVVKVNDNLLAYSWDAKANNWMVLGTVTGGAGDKTPSAEHKYDRVFNVELFGETKKIGYNKGDDLWQLAFKFLEKEDIPQERLYDAQKDLVELMEKELGIDQQDSSINFEPFVDPMSGVLIQPEGYNEYFPCRNFLKFDQINWNGMFKKIRQFTEEQPGGSASFDLSVLDQCKILYTSQSAPTTHQLQCLWRILHLPSDKVFPALDLLRVMILLPSVNRHCFSIEFRNEFLSVLLPLATDGQSAVNQRLVIRILCNGFLHDLGKECLLDSVIFGRVAGLILQLTTDSTKQQIEPQLQLSISTLILDYSIALHLHGIENVSSHFDTIGRAAEKALQGFIHNESQFRLLVALGTLFCHQKEMILGKNDLKTTVDFLRKTSTVEKIKKCAGYLYDKF